MERHEIRGAEPLTPGDHAIEWSLTKLDKVSGRGELRVDGAVVGAVEIPRIIRGWMPFNGLSLGADNGAPVATSYESPFRFNGVLHRVDVRLLGHEPGPDAVIEQRSEMGKQ